MQTAVARLLRFPRSRTRALHSVSPPQCGMHLTIIAAIFRTKLAPRSERTYATTKASSDFQSTSSDDAAPNPEGKPESRITPRPFTIKSINKALAKRKAPELVEEDLEEQFVRGMKASCSLSWYTYVSCRQWSGWTR